MSTIQMFDTGTYAPTVVKRGDVYRLDPEPFREWLTTTMQRRGLTTSDVAKLCGLNEGAVRRVRGQKVDSPTRVSDLTVEHYGIRVAGNPRLCADLYPELGH